ncbi:MAG: stage III sporulation protein AB [Oscillospiraceae bacterium]|jgi:hypothetical protein|nr:stage III sporulation protein AB [Oscillospiraceae bacterium]
MPVILKILASVTVTGACAWLGISYGLELRKNAETLRNFTAGLAVLRHEICELRSPTEEALARVYEVAGLRLFPNSKFLNVPELRYLERILGKTDLDAQRSAIIRAETRAAALLQDAEAHLRERGKVFAAAGVSIGLTLVIILI